MNKDELRELRNNINELKKNSNAVYKKQNAEREAYLNATENQKEISEIKASLKTAQIIYNMRREAGLSQSQLADCLHMKQPNYARIEKGQNITINTLADIATACGAEIELKYHLIN
jgi:ribosome-binding protein aMBF1 (putative translation factor)